jgi:prepilin-type N-terminal cleavage/methylation domain-containing protein
MERLLSTVATHLPDAASQGPRRAGCGGLTLPEVLVVLVILAALAAVLVPALINQVGKADVAAVVTDLKAIKRAAEAFASDLERLPGDLEDLTAPLTASDSSVDGVPYPARLRSRWAGPYLDRLVADGGSLRTGFGGAILDNFTTVTAENGVTYLTVRVAGISLANFYQVDQAMDGDTAVAAGMLRWVFGDTLKFLAVPR